MENFDEFTFFKEGLKILLDDLINNQHNAKPLQTNPNDFNDNEANDENINKLTDALIQGVNKESKASEELLKILKAYLLASPRLDSHRFYGERHGRIELSAMLGFMLSELMNVSVYTYEIGTLFIFMEEEVHYKLNGFLGWDNSDYIFTPGASSGHFYAVNLAANRLQPNIRQEGMKALEQPTIYTARVLYGEACRSARLTCIGYDNVKIVESDSNGSMNPRHLEELLQQDLKAHRTPLIVFAAAGPTHVDVFDPLHELSNVCEKYGVWLHVDASAGGSLLLLTPSSPLLEGIEKANSIVWCPHDTLNIPLDCSLIIARGDQKAFRKVFSASASYLFQEDKYYDISRDTGDKSVQCGRKNDVLKLWTTWHLHGQMGLAKIVRRKMKFATFIASQMQSRADLFHVVMEPNFTTVLFYVKPRSMPDALWVAGPHAKQTWLESASQTAIEVKQKLLLRGKLILNVVKNPLLSKEENNEHAFCLRLCVSADIAKVLWQSEFEFLVKEIESVV